MDEVSEASWSDIEKEKQLLFSDIVESLSPDEFEILKEVLKLQADNRHLTKPHHMKRQTLQIIERVVE